MNDTIQSFSISISSTRQVAFHRIGLKKWLELDHIWTEIHRSAAERSDQFTGKVFEYLSAASGEDIEIWEYLPWSQVAETVLKVWDLNKPRQRLPMYTDKRLQSGSQVPWEYQGREWYVWVNTFASAYHWTIEYIAELDIDDAAALFQELIIEDQLKKEWDWGLSERAYVYNQYTKRSDFKPLDRPLWMREQIPQPKKIKIRRDMMPVGNVIDLGQLYGNKPNG